MSLERGTLLQALEAVIFASEEPVARERLVDLFAADGVAAEEIDQGLAALATSYAERGLELVEIGGGYQLRTRPQLAPWLARLEVQRPVRFSRAALECLAIVAYRQPVTRAEVEEVRGVDSGGVLRTLLDKGLVRIVGKKDVPGRPLLYGTSRRFLEVFGLASLAQLPSLRDIEALLEERAEAVELPEEEHPGGTGERLGAAAAEPPPREGGPAAPDEEDGTQDGG